MEEIKTIRRSEELIADFENGYTKGWYFKIPESLKDALDIKLTQRKKDKRTVLVWTQGLIYDFKKGDTLLNHIYPTEQWFETLQNLDYCLQVETASSCALIEIKENSANETIVEEKSTEEVNLQVSGIIDETNNADKEKQGKKKKKRYKLDPGNVKYTIYKPNSTKTALESVGTKECTQVEFVEILKNGFVPKEKKEVNPENEQMTLLLS